MILRNKIYTVLSHARDCVHTGLYSLGIVLTGCMLAASLQSCKDEMGEEDNPYIPKEDYYITLNVSTAANGTTRSETTVNGESSDNIVPAASEENVLKTATVYLCLKNADGDYEVKTSFQTSGYIPAPDDQNATFLFCKIADLKPLTDLHGEIVNIIVVGNEDQNVFSHDPLKTVNVSDAKFSVTGANSRPLGDYGNDNKGLLMPLVSADNFLVKIPDGTDDKDILENVKGLFARKTATNSWWDVESTDQQTQLKLERGVARLEYRGKIDAETKAESHVYKIGNLNVDIELYSMTPFNVNQECYLFKHTLLGSKADATDGNNKIGVFGKERGNQEGYYNWVASPWWESDSKEPSLFNKLTIEENEYENKEYVVGDNWAGEVFLKEVGARQVSEPLKAKNNGTWEGGYHPMCYVSENTLYSTALMKDDEVLKYATGVAFKFKVLDKNGKAIKKGESDEKDFPLEISWNPEAGKGDHLNITDLETWKWVDIAPDDEDGCYYITFIACIVHNAPQTTMETIAPMFYGIVRNNSYQMSIKSIEGLPNPNDPRSLFLTLDINVLNWDRKDVGYDF